MVTPSQRAMWRMSSRSDPLSQPWPLSVALAGSPLAPRMATCFFPFRTITRGSRYWPSATRIVPPGLTPSTASSNWSDYLFLLYAPRVPGRRGAPLEYQRTIRPDPERVLAESGKGFCREKDPKTSPAFMKLDRGSNEVAFADSIRSARREMKMRKRLRAFWLNSESRAWHGAD